MTIKFTDEILNNIEKFTNDVKNFSDIVNFEYELIFMEEDRLQKLNKKLEIEINDGLGKVTKVDIKTFMDELKFDLANGDKNARSMKTLKIAFPNLYKAILQEAEARNILNSYIMGELGISPDHMNTTTMLSIIKGMTAYMTIDCLKEADLIDEEKAKVLKSKYDYEEEAEVEVADGDVLLKDIKDLQIGTKIQVLKSGIQNDSNVKKGMILEITKIFKFHIETKDKYNRVFGFGNKNFQFLKLIEYPIKKESDEVKKED